MAEPRQKSLDTPTFLTRIIPLWQSPSWMEADRWRRVVANQPVAAICESVLIADLTDTHWEIRARDPKDEDKVADDIEAYTKILNPDMPGALSGFDIWVSMMAQDVLTVPIGGNSEVVRYRDGMGPFSQPHPKGHVFKVVYIDGATLAPTFDEQFPMVQRLRGDLINAAYFGRDEIMRIVLKPRPEMERWGYGMAPPEKIYLAINLLYRGDTYYANLLLDTPEAGLLDLGDMDRESATQWVQSFRELFSGIDPFKIPVLYEHTTPAQFISFGRPPTDMLFDKTTLKYAQIATAGYGLSLTDIGLGDPQKTLAGSIRDERRTRRSGFGVLKEKLRAGIDNDILPPYLEFVWQENDEEALIQKGRAFLTYAQALKAAKEAGFIKAAEGQKDLQAQGFLEGIELEEPEDPPPMPALPPGTPAANGNQQVQQEMERKPAAEGGRGDITGKAELGPVTITAAPPETSYYDQLANVMRGAFSGVVTRMERPRLMRLIKAVTRKMLPDTAKAFIALSDPELPLWKEERIRFWFGEPTGFDEFPFVVRAGEEVLAEIERILDLEDWWQIGDDVTPAISLIFRLAYGEGATVAAQMVQEALYTEGLVDTPNIIGLSFDLKNPRTLAELEAKAAELVRRVNDGTRYYLKRIITSGVDEGLSSPDIARLIREGAGADDVLRQAGYSERVIDTVKAEVGGMTEYRTNSIVNTEINRAESMGRLGQWVEMGLTQKRWRHTGADDACYICRSNQDLGFVPMDYVFNDSFDGTQTPPGHPGVCHCHIEFDEEELMSKADTLNVWSGE